MKPAKSQRQFRRAAQSLEAGLSRVRDQGAARRGEMIRNAAFVLALVLVGALIFDLSGTAGRAREAEAVLDRELTGIADGSLLVPYEDPSGRFAVQTPSNWMNQTGEKAGFSLFVVGEHGTDFGVVTAEVDDDSFPTLLRKLDEVDRKLGLSIEHEIVTAAGQRAVRRITSLAGRRLITIDFAVNGISHHLQFSAHPELFERYLPAVNRLIEGYRPGPVENL